MKVGVVKEIKDQENRVALTPAGARVMAAAGHQVCVEFSAGAGSGHDDRGYRAAGAELVPVEDAWCSDLVLKVKEPLETEYRFLQGQILFAYLHLAGAPAQLTETLLASRTLAVAYETVEDADGRLPLLAPMSAIAGTMAFSVGNHYLAHTGGGKGVLLGSMLGRKHGKVVVIGDGVVGRHAAHAAAGAGAEVVVFGLSAPVAASGQQPFPSGGIRHLVSDSQAIALQMEDADLLVGAVLARGARAPHIVTESMVMGMEPGSVIVDVSIDQGGCMETSRPTTHSDPVYVRHGVVHYAVTNMPGAYPRSSTLALTDATLPYALRLAQGGTGALRADAGFARGVNTCNGFVCCRPVAEALSLMDRFRPFDGIPESRP
ncbi:MAG: alanine dehydrogenase [Pseudomonadota bacterium]|nr:alanine dehydrogenase [Pseudomonadota bacterium]